MTVVVEYEDRRDDETDTLWEISEVHTDVMYVRWERENGRLWKPDGSLVFPDDLPEHVKIYGEVRIE